MAGTVFGKWYWADWMSDPGVRASSYAARGLWMDMLCLMAQADPVGSLVLNGRGLDAAGLARLTGGEQTEVEGLLAELEQNGVFARDRNGFIFNRRMKKEQKKAKTAIKNGRMGGNPTLRKQNEIPASDNPPDKVEDNGGDTPHGNKPEAISQKLASASLEREVREKITRAFTELAPSRLPPDTNRAVVWLAQGFEPDLILAVVREGLARKPDVGSLTYFDRRLEEARKGRPAAGPSPVAPERPTPLPDPIAMRRHQLGMAMDFFRGRWHPNWPESLKPDHPDCTTPADVIDEARNAVDVERAMSPAERADRLGIVVARQA